ncbi:hypothetical protein [Streptomyces sp. NPDC007984]|uniref:hypothetical protein n=1 Tax=Streptomyces sp. NPDC007984 TaxID=3364801 RepID=UPI0036EDD8D4
MTADAHRVTEYVDHPYEHFAAPVVIRTRDDGHHAAPLTFWAADLTVAEDAG